MSHLTAVTPVPASPAPLKVGQPITLVTMNALAMTNTAHVYFVAWTEDKKLHFTAPRKRGTFSVKLDKTTLVFPDHIPAPLSDMETSTFWGNAKINLIGEPKALRALIETNLNPFFTERERITYRAASDKGEDLKPLFPKDKRAEAIEIFGASAVNLAVSMVEMSDPDAAFTTLEDAGEEEAAAAVEFLYFEE